MAEWYGTARSNFFQVNDEAEFRAWAEQQSLTVWEQTIDGIKRFAILPRDSQFGGWEYWNLDDEAGDDDEPERIVFAKKLAPYLRPGSVAILEECGAAGLRYISGDAIAINSKGAMATVSLSDITEKAKGLGHDVVPTW